MGLKFKNLVTVKPGQSYSETADFVRDNSGQKNLSHKSKREIIIKTVDGKELSNLPDHLEDKYKKLQNCLREMGSVVIGFSGGVDSTFLLKVAYDVLGDQVLAITSQSEIHPEEELLEARKLANIIGSRHLLIQTKELVNVDFVRNDKKRCYYCKKELFSTIGQMAQELQIKYVLDGSNFDDLNDYRPGLEAIRELGVRSPLLEAELTKAEIRELSKRLELPTWDKPAFACLSTRLPYGEPITSENLVMVSKAEGYLRSLGIGQLRVRHHGTRTARIEVLPEDMVTILEFRDKVVTYLKSLGYTYITLDLQGYRTGSMNEVLSEEVKNNG